MAAGSPAAGKRPRSSITDSSSSSITDSSSSITDGSSSLPPSKKLHREAVPTDPLEAAATEVKPKPTEPAKFQSRPLKSWGSKHRSRTKRCGTCEGCTAESCGTCQSCRINSQFSDILKNGMAECLKKVCDNPILLTADSIKDLGSVKSKMEAMMKIQDDGTCPFKMIDGKLVDFRCFICKKLPRAGMANRSELYRHYSLYHFKEQLIKEFGHLTTCTKCGKNQKGGAGMADHMGQVHDEVDKYLPADNRIVKKSASRSRPGGQGKVKARKFYGFPDVPEGYDPATRTVQSTYEPEGVLVEGFKVVLHAVVEPPVKLVPQPVLQLINEKYKGFFGSCVICRGDSVDIGDLMDHLVTEHCMYLEPEPGEDIIDFLIKEAEYIKVSSEPPADPVADDVAKKDPTEKQSDSNGALENSDANDNQTSAFDSGLINAFDDHSYASVLSKSSSSLGEDESDATEDSVESKDAVTVPENALEDLKKITTDSVICNGNNDEDKAEEESVKNRDALDQISSLNGFVNNGASLASSDDAMEDVITLDAISDKDLVKNDATINSLGVALQMYLEEYDTEKENIEPNN